MSASIIKPGLGYKKLDLHVHTPGSDCFNGDCTPDELVNTAISRGLAGIAITDHNSAEWIDRVVAAAKGKPITVFPGVEITCQSGGGSIHIVGIFDVKKTAEDIKALLNKLDIGRESYGKQETLVQKTPQEVLQMIQQLDGLAVLAHANSSNGVLHDMSGQARIAVIQCPALAAVEGTDFADETKKQRHRRVCDLLDGTDLNYRKLAVYQASDNPCPDGSGRHGLEGIGERCAFFKVERVDLDGLRQCFADPDVRIRQDFETLDTVYPRISKLKITGGFLDGTRIEFHEGLTSVLGGKGAGKSLLVEFMRFALNQEPKNPAILEDHAGKLRSRLMEYGIVEVIFVDETGQEHHVARTYRELDDSPYDEDTVPYDPAQNFQVLFLSQNEIIKIAEDEDAQLDFIDSFFDFRAHKSQIAAIEQRLRQLDLTMGDGLRAFSDVEDLTKQIQTLQIEIGKLDRALGHPVFQKYRDLELKERAFSEQDLYLGAVAENVEKARAELQKKSAPSLPDVLRRDPALQRNRGLIDEALHTLNVQLSSLHENVIKARASTRKEHDSWRPDYLTGKKEYEEYIKAMGGDYQVLAQSRAKAMRQLEDLQRQLIAAETRKSEVTPVNAERNRLLDLLQREYELYTKARSAKCEKFQRDSTGKLQLRILGSSNVDEFRESLLSLKKGSYLRESDIESICSHVNPREFIMSLLHYQAKKETKFLEKSAKLAGIDLGRMKTLADFLLMSIPYESLLALQYEALPQDRPEILYNIGGGNYQPLNAVSVGQKCTAMLIMALSDGTMPIVVDQPEDSLDIKSIWEDVCVKVRTGKECRQFIFTTHNSSLAVASDTDCYVIVEGDASRGRVVHVGSMDHEPVGGEVLTYLEGGRETYLRKFTKYGAERKLRPQAERT